MKANSDAQSAARTDAAIPHAHLAERQNDQTRGLVEDAEAAIERVNALGKERPLNRLVGKGRGLLPGGRAGLRRLPPEGGLDVV